MLTGSTARFSNRVEDYIRYRPHYPAQLIDFLKNHLQLNRNAIVADIGSGTGISSELFLKNGNKVFAVEPNKEMREAAEKIFSYDKNFTSIHSAAENTTLPDHSVDFIICAQAFHWFDKKRTKKEFDRILKPDGHILLIWNSRKENDAFQKLYEQCLFENIPEYKSVNHRNIDDAEIEKFFSPKATHETIFSNHQDFDLQGLKGRLLSSSYCPKEGELHDLLMKKMEELFEKFNSDGIVGFEYETKLYYC